MQNPSGEVGRLLKLKSLILSLFLLASSLALAAAEPEQKFAALGDFQLESGKVIKNLQVGYRTAGELNSARSNAVLFPTWFTGTTKVLVNYVGPGKLVDSSKYFVILVDALGDGVSSSPSNSREQPRMQFPEFNIRDMVRAEHELAAGPLKLAHLRAVIGISMGGMQAFQWMVSYPDFMDKVVPIVGSPQLSSYDLLLWNAELHAFESDPAWNGGNYSSPPPAGTATVADIFALAMTSPQERVQHIARRDFPQFLESNRRDLTRNFDANDQIRQLQAMIADDVAAPFGGSLEKAAAAVRARVLIVVGLRDHVVNPTPALDFARLIFAPTLELDSDCGHMSFQCELDKVTQTVGRFLAE
jgi:homoserine O-acetyltransferase